MEFRCGGLFFTSKFDSGNLARVEKTSRDEEDDENTHRGMANAICSYITLMVVINTNHVTVIFIRQYIVV